MTREEMDRIYEDERRKLEEGLVGSPAGSKWCGAAVAALGKLRSRSCAVADVCVCCSGKPRLGGRGLDRLPSLIVSSTCGGAKTSQRSGLSRFHREAQLPPRGPIQAGISAGGGPTQKNE